MTGSARKLDKARLNCADALLVVQRVAHHPSSSCLSLNRKVIEQPSYMNKKACFNRSNKSNLKFVIAAFICLPKIGEFITMTSSHHRYGSNRQAIAWDKDLIPKDSCYWNDKWLYLLQQHNPEGCTISYQTLIRVASFIAADLRVTMKERATREADHNHQSKTTIPIMVAIPEGPLLPLAVLVVHALNDPIVLDSSSTAVCCSILVPLEPSEPLKRNIHIIKDVSPSMILAVPGNDNDRIQAMLDSISPSGCLTNLVDFPDLIHSAMQKIESRPNFLKEIDELFDKIGPNQCHLRTLVSICADLISEDRVEGDSNKEILQDKMVERIRLSNETPRISHIVYTSGTTGIPKGCISSISSLEGYLKNKNEAYNVSQDSNVLLASALSFDPCLSDCLASFEARATLILAPRSTFLSALPNILKELEVTHVLCTPTLWSLMGNYHPRDFPSLKAIALGGEPIPRQLQQRWARKLGSFDSPSDLSCRLYATYGVTEACVYQTCGEIFSSEKGNGQYVGQAFQGVGIRICNETTHDALVDTEAGAAGEIVLFGSQLDRFSGYLKRPEIYHKFAMEVSENSKDKIQHYRTGDRGTYDDKGGLRVLGRIMGEEGMVKVNGVRVELGEIENALVDETNEEEDQTSSVVLNCIAKVAKISSEGNTGESAMDRNEIRVYCILSDSARKEVGLEKANDSSSTFGVLVNGGPLLTLLRARCLERIKPACMPIAFIVIPRLPLSPTGKRNRDRLPEIDTCSHLIKQEESISLKEYGLAGSKVSEILIECLNLQPSQEVMLTTSVTFAMLGGDSLTATRVTRALYAYHHQVDNNRRLGGQFGKLEGPFNVINLIRSKDLGSYVQMLDGQNLCTPKEVGEARPVKNGKVDDEAKQSDSNPPTEIEMGSKEDENEQADMYDALLQAATLSQSSIALGLLDAGADPNYGGHSGRLGKVTHRLKQQALFRSIPLHLACLRGDDPLVKKLLAKESKFNSPDASGIFPLHLASSGLDGEARVIKDDLKRLRCVQYLFEAGAPVTMRDANKQTVLHCAARAGHCQVLEFVMKTWEEKNGDRITPKHFFNWNDRWMRSPVHWAILNGRLEALKVLLQHGCSAMPPRPKRNNRSSAAVESPLEICERLYGVKAGKGAEMRNLLLSHRTKLEKLEKKRES